MATRRIEKERIQKARLYKEQSEKCYWCGRQMLENWKAKDHHRVPDDLATREHLDSKLSGTRRKYNGELRVVLACNRCNHARSRKGR